MEEFKSDKLIKKYGGDIFSETRLDDGLHSIVDKNEPVEESQAAETCRQDGPPGVVGG